MNDDTPRTRTTEGLTLVLGGTGKSGRRVVKRLKSLGVATRATSRSAVPFFDWSEPGSWDAALEGVTAACLSYAPDLAIGGARESTDFSEYAHQIAASGLWKAPWSPEKAVAR